MTTTEINRMVAENARLKKALDDLVEQVEMAQGLMCMEGGEFDLTLAQETLSGKVNQ